MTRTHLQIGDVLGPYRIVGHVGDGGMGQVYRAKDGRLGRDVALKVLPPDMAGDTERRGRMEREARAMGMLNHPNVVTVFDIGVHDGAPFIVTELLEGRTLRQRLADADAGGDRVPVDEALAIVTSVADALGAAHGRGIVHRDIKPENIFLTGDGRTKVLDFGIAKLAPVVRPGSGVTATITAAGLQTAGIEATEAGVIIGTLAYMAPEQIRGETAAAGADVYACGVVAFELLTGNRPFAGASQATLIGAALHEPPPPVSGVPPALAALVARCLAKRADERFQDGTALALALRGLAAGGAGGTAQASVSRRWSLSTVGVAVVIGVVAAGAAWGTFGRADAPPVATSPATQAVEPATSPATPAPATPAPTQTPGAPPATSPAATRSRDAARPIGRGTTPNVSRAGTAPSPAPVALPPPSDPMPAIPLDGVWALSEQVVEDAKGIDCAASGVLRLTDKDGLLDGTLQLRQDCTDRTRATRETTDATTPLTAGTGTADGVSFVTRHREDGLVTTCRYAGRILGSGRRAMAGDITCDARATGASAVLNLRGTWRATRTTP